jgi:hypothetical protein
MNTTTIATMFVAVAAVAVALTGAPAAQA